MPEPEPDVIRRLIDLALELGRADLAGDLARLGANPPPAPGRPAEEIHAAGMQFLQRQQPQEAAAAFVQALRLRPDQAEWHEHLGVALAQQRQFAEAEATFRIAVRLDPSRGSAVRNLIRSCIDQRKWEAATSAIRDALEREPDAEDLVLRLAAVRCEARAFAEAEADLRRRLADRPDWEAGWHQLGVVLGEAGKLAESEQCFREEIRINPRSAAGYANLAAALGKCDRWAEAEAAGREATRLDPNHAGAWSNLGNALRDLGRPDEAIPVLQQAIRLAPQAAEPYGNLGLAMAMTGRTAEAVAWYERSLQLRGDAAEVRFNRAVALLGLGDYEHGWQEYEWRWRTDQMKGTRRKFPVPAWDGSPPAGKTILLHAEQGLGDTIQFFRLASVLAERGATVIAQVPEPLIMLMRTCPGVSDVLTPGGPVPAFDWNCPLMSLPLALRLKVADIPNRVPYLTASTASVEKWRSRLAGERGRRVGIVWQGNPNHIGDRWRSVRLAQFESLAAVPGVRLIGLQTGPGHEQVAGTPAVPLLDLGPELGPDLDDLAGLLTNLDLVVAVDTAPVHLAGALGRPVWVALPLNNDWRWFSGRPDSPWYPTARLYRQARFGDWGPVFAELAGELSRWAKSG
jgi:tetratricopeptide (TPR) repeat protein